MLELCKKWARAARGLNATLELKWRAPPWLLACANLCCTLGGYGILFTAILVIAVGKKIIVFAFVFSLLTMLFVKLGVTLLLTAFLLPVAFNAVRVMRHLSDPTFEAE